MTGREALIAAARQRADEIERVRSRGNFAYGGESDIRLLRGLADEIEALRKKLDEYDKYVAEFTNGA